MSVNKRAIDFVSLIFLLFALVACQGNTTEELLPPVLENGETAAEPVSEIENSPAVVESDNSLAPEETHPEEAAVVVVGWIGYVTSTPIGAQFDDYVTILPESQVGQFGIAGASEDVEAQIVALRDREQPGKFAHFWGRLTCDVPDFGGCQLLAERVHVSGPAGSSTPEQVEGWQGTIAELFYDEPGAPQPDDAFVPLGDYPVQYGIDSAISAQSGERDLVSEIARLRSNGEVARIWGMLVCAVPDAGGCHIEVYRIETTNEVYEITPIQ